MTCLAIASGLKTLEKGFATERPQAGEKRDWEVADMDRMLAF
jgi:hypothetical protein